MIIHTSRTVHVITSLDLNLISADLISSELSGGCSELVKKRPSSPWLRPTRTGNLLDGDLSSPCHRSSQVSPSASIITWGLRNCVSIGRSHGKLSRFTAHDSVQMRWDSAMWTLLLWSAKP